VIMTDPSPFDRLRDLPLPELDPALTAAIRRRGHARLRAGNRGPWMERLARALVAAAVVSLCVLQAGWTVAFLSRLYE